MKKVVLQRKPLESGSFECVERDRYPVVIDSLASLQGIQIRLLEKATSRFFFL